MEHRATLQYTADEVYATMVDKACLTARLEQMGGPGARLLEHRADAAGARYTLRHGLSKAQLPPIVATLLPGDIVIERTETLRREGTGRYAGEVDVRIKGTPASASGWMRLRDRSAGSELLVHADVRVDVPFIGGKIETIIAEQIKTLMNAETDFTLDWLARVGRPE